MKLTTRSRHAVPYIGVLVLALVLAACGDGGDAPDADPPEAAEEEPEEPEETEEPEEPEEEPEEPQELVELTYPMLAGGAGLIPMHYISSTGIDEKHGIKMVLRDYDDLATYYSDGAQGILDIVHGSADAFAAQASQGVPIELLATMTPWHGWIVAHDDFEFEDPTSIMGSRLSTIAASGTFQTVIGAFKEWYDIDIEDGAEIVGAGNPAAAMTQVSAGTADVGLSWEPSVTAAMQQDESLSVVYDLGEEFEEQYGLEMWHFVMVMQSENDHPEGTVENFIAMFQEAAEAMHADPEEADQFAQEVGFEPGVVQEALESGRLVYDIRPVDAEVADSIRQMLNFLPSERFEGEIPDSFYGGY